jgi:hypothetical protein
MRIPEKEIDYFNYVLHDITVNIKNSKEHIENNTGSSYHVHLSYFSGLYQLLFVTYSLGYPLINLKETLYEALDVFFKKIPLYKAHPQFKYLKLNTHLGRYQPYLDLLCFGILLKIEDSILDKFKYELDETYGRDLLLENIWAAYKKQPLTLEPKTKLLYPKSFDMLFQSYLLSGPEKEKIILQYSLSWMKTKKSAPWYGAKKIFYVNGPVAYVGYWNLEEAATAYLAGMKASQFEKIEYFPIDLLIFSQT